jgi:hypothetical protein
VDDQIDQTKTSFTKVPDDTLKHHKTAIFLMPCNSAAHATANNYWHSYKNAEKDQLQIMLETATLDPFLTCCTCGVECSGVVCAASRSQHTRNRALGHVQLPTEFLEQRMGQSPHLLCTGSRHNLVWGGPMGVRDLGGLCLELTGLPGRGPRACRSSRACRGTGSTTGGVGASKL